MLPPDIWRKGYGADSLDSYRTTLNARETIEDHDEQENMLKACHKRCAERTLVVLEKNGGIFIKLGQHLVRIPLDLWLGERYANNRIERHELPSTF
jgi:hypothetical protein